MADAPTYKDFFRIARDEIITRNGAVTREVVERAGSTANLMVAASAAVADDNAAELVRVESGLFLDSARRSQLDRWAFDRYGLTRKAASAALGTVEFSTAAVTAAAFTIPAGTQLSTSDGRSFLTLTAALFPAGSVGPLAVSVRSTLPGAAQQTLAGAITSIVSAIPGAPAGLSVTNSLATAGADDEESDEQLRTRCRAFYTSVRRGTIGAIQTAALAVPGVRTATAFESYDLFGRPAGVVQLVIADAFTESLVSVAPTPAAYTTQSQVLADGVFDALIDVRAAGIFVNVIVAQVRLMGVVLGLSFEGSAGVDAVALQARAVVVGYINALVPGERFSRTEAVRRLGAVPGLVITGNEIISPPGDVVPQALEVMRASLSLVVASSVQPERALQGSTNPDV